MVVPATPKKLQLTYDAEYNVRYEYFASITSVYLYLVAGDLTSLKRVEMSDSSWMGPQLTQATQVKTLSPSLADLNEPRFNL
jgi:hypothetical protein